jgi:peptidoglycan/xylan/chitin deacetylase (PgdA/CDA1 family)
MQTLMISHNFDQSQVPSKVFMQPYMLKELIEKDHLIGLHSHSHPTQIHKLSEGGQRNEYELNYKLLFEVIKSDIDMMAHPCGQYNDLTLKILKDLNVKIGFRSSLSKTQPNSLLEIPRADHANLMREYKI